MSNYCFDSVKYVLNPLRPFFILNAIIGAQTKNQIWKSFDSSFFEAAFCAGSLTCQNRQLEAPTFREPGFGKTDFLKTDSLGTVNCVMECWEPCSGELSLRDLKLMEPSIRGTKCLETVI